MVLSNDPNNHECLYFTIREESTSPDNPSTSDKPVFAGIVHVASKGITLIDVVFSLPGTLRVGQPMSELSPEARGVITAVYLNGRDITNRL
jgi:hypothetical protein